jgi:hypothetical protein
MSDTKEEKVEKSEIDQCDAEIAQKLVELHEMEAQRLKSPFTNTNRVKSKEK